MTASLPNRTSAEVGIIGYEGMLNHALVLGVDRSSSDCFIQIGEAQGYRIDAEQLRAAVSQSSSLRFLLLRFTQALFVQVARNSVAGTHFQMEARLARWLLMCHDRIEGEDLNLTHEFMALMIGAQRTGVTVTLHMLESAGAIRARRGRVTIIDRGKLEELAEHAYGPAEAEFRRLIGPFGKSALPNGRADEARVA